MLDFHVIMTKENMQSHIGGHKCSILKRHFLRDKYLLLLRCDNFIDLPQQITINEVAENNKNLSFHSSAACLSYAMLSMKTPWGKCAPANLLASGDPKKVRHLPHENSCRLCCDMVFPCVSTCVQKCILVGGHIPLIYNY